MSRAHKGIMCASQRARLVHLSRFASPFTAARATVVSPPRWKPYSLNRRLLYQNGTRRKSSDSSHTLDTRNTKSRSEARLLSPLPFIIHSISSHPEHGIRGDSLCIIGPEDLKEFGITTVGQRLSILRAVYYIKLAHNVPIETDHYVPPCAFWKRIESRSSHMVS